MSIIHQILEADPLLIRDQFNQRVFGENANNITQYAERVTCGKNINVDDLIVYCQNCCVFIYTIFYYKHRKIEHAFIVLIVLKRKIIKATFTVIVYRVVESVIVGIIL